MPATTRPPLTRDTITNLRHRDWHVKHADGRGWPVSVIAACYGVSDEAVRKGIKRVDRALETAEDVVGL